MYQRRVKLIDFRSTKKLEKCDCGAKPFYLISIDLQVKLTYIRRTIFRGRIATKCNITEIH